MKKILISAILVLSSLLIFIIIAEVSLRCFQKPKKGIYEVLAEFKYDDYENIEKSGFFRKKLPQLHKPKSTYRILALGDSFTWGAFIKNAKNTWPSILEKILQEKYTHKIEVINLGVSGFTTLNEYELLEKIGWKFSPDLIVIQYGLNDPLPSGKNFARMGGTDFFKTKDLIANKKLHGFLNAHSRFYTHLNKHYANFQSRIKYSESWGLLYKDDFSGWKNCKAALAAITSSAHKHNSQAILVLFPYFPEGKHTLESYPFSKLLEMVEKTAIDSGLPVINLLETFVAKDKDFKYWWALDVDAHPNSKAHQVAAEAISSFIINNKFIPD